MPDETLTTREQHFANKAARRSKRCGVCGGAGVKASGDGAAERVVRSRKRTFAQLAKGTFGLTQEALGLDAADDDVVTARWSTCSGCPSNDRGICSECRCHLSAKVRLASQSCPAGKW